LSKQGFKNAIKQSDFAINQRSHGFFSLFINSCASAAWRTAFHACADINLIGLFFQCADQGEVRHDEARGGAGIDVVADKPVHQTVVKI
jgi:hypothetical protein